MLSRVSEELLLPISICRPILLVSSSQVYAKFLRITVFKYTTHTFFKPSTDEGKKNLRKNYYSMVHGSCKGYCLGLYVVKLGGGEGRPERK